MQKLLDRWEQGLMAALILAVGLIGIGRVELFSPEITVRAWSTSRTAFFFWLIWKGLIWYRSKNSQECFSRLTMPAPVWVFFVTITLSLLPDFHDASDYRYFFFASMHYLMIVDLFGKPERWQLLYRLIALLPVVIVVRGILHDPSVLQLEQMQRFGYPLPHPNIAGYLFTMSIPLCLAIAFAESGRLRGLAMGSGAAQLFALVLTYSRGSWMGWFASMLFIGVALKRKEVAILFLAAGVLVVATAPLRERALSLIRPSSDISINERKQAMEAGLRLGSEHPLLGAGYGRGRLREGLREVYGGPTPGVTHIAHTHNVYIELFATTGILGLGAFLWLLGDGLFRTLRISGRVNREGRIFQLGIAAALVALAVTGLGDVPFYHHEVRILFFTLLALAYLRERETRAAMNP